MAQLGIKVEDLIKEDFIALCSEMSLTQPAMIEKMLQVMRAKPGEAPVLLALQDKLDKEVKAHASTQLALTDEVNKFNTLNDLLTKTQSELHQANEEIQKSKDLTGDVKELGALQKLSKAVHVYVKRVARNAFRNADAITEEKAAELFIKDNQD